MPRGCQRAQAQGNSALQKLAENLGLWPTHSEFFPPYPLTTPTLPSLHVPVAFLLNVHFDTSPPPPTNFLLNASCVPGTARAPYEHPQPSQPPGGIHHQYPFTDEPQRG